MTNRTWNDGDALTGATLNKDISQAVSAGGTFTPYTPLVGNFSRDSSVSAAGGRGAPVSLGGSQSTGGYSLQGDLVRFWALFRWDASMTFNGTPPSSGSIARTFVMGAPFPVRRIDWQTAYYGLTGNDLAVARWFPSSIKTSLRIDPAAGFSPGWQLSPLYQANETTHMDTLTTHYTEAQVAALIQFRVGVGGNLRSNLYNRDVYFDDFTGAAGSTPTANAYNFTDENYGAWFAMSGWFIRTDDRLIEHPTHVQ